MFSLFSQQVPGAALWASGTVGEGRGRVVAITGGGGGVESSWLGMECVVWGLSIKLK